MSLEDELRDAISLRNEMAVALAVSLLRLTTEDGMGPSEIADHGIIGGKYAKLATDIEALTAVILQRCGVSWDTMAARADVSRQTLHRRLSARGEELFDDAVYELLSDREYDSKVLTKALRKAKAIDSLLDRSQALRRLPTKTALHVERLAALPDPEEILAAPEVLAANLVELRQIPRWWARDPCDGDDDGWDED